MILIFLFGLLITILKWVNASILEKPRLKENPLFDFFKLNITYYFHTIKKANNGWTADYANII